MKYIDLAFQILGGLYVILSAVQTATPTSKLGQFCARWGAIVRKVEQLGEPSK